MPLSFQRLFSFWLIGKGWVAAGKLQKGDALILQNGESITVQSVEVKELDHSIKVYNFEVEELHCYFVGYQRVLVHNACQMGAAPEKTAVDMAKQIERDLGKEARREFHDVKSGGDRTVQELKADAAEIYERFGKEPPKWMK